MQYSLQLLHREAGGRVSPVSRVSWDVGKTGTDVSHASSPGEWIALVPPPFST